MSNRDRDSARKIEEQLEMWSADCCSSYECGEPDQVSMTFLRSILSPINLYLRGQVECHEDNGEIRSEIAGALIDRGKSMAMLLRCGCGAVDTHQFHADMAVRCGSCIDPHAPIGDALPSSPIRLTPPKGRGPSVSGLLLMVAVSLAASSVVLAPHGSVGGSGIARALTDVSVGTEELREMARDLSSPMWSLAFRQLRAAGDPSVESIAREYIRSGDVVAAGWGFDALGDMGSTVTREDAGPILGSASPQDRISPLYALACCGDGGALEELIGYVDDNPSMGVMIKASRRLLRIDRLEYGCIVSSAVDEINDQFARAIAKDQIGSTAWILE